MKKNLKKVFYLLMLGIMMYAPTAMALECKFEGNDLKMISGSKAIVIDSQIPHTVHLIIVILRNNLYIFKSNI